MTSVQPSQVGSGEDGAAQAGFGAARVAAGLLQFALVATLGVAVLWFGDDLITNVTTHLDSCDRSGAGIECLTAAPMWQALWWPLVSAIAALSMFRGAMVANARRPASGIAYSVLGLAVLGGTLWWSLG